MVAVEKSLASLVPPDRAKKLMADLASGKLKPAADRILVEPPLAVVVPSVVRPMEKPDWIPDNWDRPGPTSISSHRLLDELLIRKIQGRRFHPDALDRVVEAVEFGADIHLRFSEGMDALMFSLDRRFDEPNLRITEYLLRKGASTQTRSGSITPLILAISSQVTEAVKLLFADFVKQKPDVEDCDYDGVTPLMVAVKYPNLEIVEFLLQQGADQMKKDRDGRNARSHAFRGALLGQNADVYTVLARYPPKNPDDTQKGDNDDL